jgi:hypothetical protein
VSRDIKTGPGDDRQDGAKRDRIDELVSSMGAYRRDLDARYGKVVKAVCAAIVIAAVTFVISAMLYQGQRWSQTVDACERTNAQTDATINLLRDLNVPPRVITAAQRRYPHVPPLIKTPDYTGPLTCHQYASEKVTGPKL